MSYQIQDLIVMEISIGKACCTAQIPVTPFYSLLWKFAFKSLTSVSVHGTQQGVNWQLCSSGQCKIANQILLAWVNSQSTVGYVFFKKTRSISQHRTTTHPSLTLTKQWRNCLNIWENSICFYLDLSESTQGGRECRVSVPYTHTRTETLHKLLEFHLPL